MSWNITDRKRLENAIFAMKFKLARKVGVKQDMTVINANCEQGGFTSSIAVLVREQGEIHGIK